MTAPHSTAFGGLGGRRRWGEGAILVQQPDVAIAKRFLTFVSHKHLKK
jgi:hypothetical protein